jgi:hypothetical protein
LLVSLQKHACSSGLESNKQDSSSSSSKYIFQYRVVSETDNQVFNVSQKTESCRFWTSLHRNVLAKGKLSSKYFVGRKKGENPTWRDPEVSRESSMRLKTGEGGNGENRQEARPP